MKTFKLVLFIFVALFITSCSRIDAGHTGIKVNLYGDDKGVDQVREVTGTVWYNPLTQQVYEWPLFVQDKDYEMELITEDGLMVKILCGLNYRVSPDQVTQVFETYRLTLPELEDGILSKRVREAWSLAIDSFTAEQVYTQKEEIRKLASSILQNDLEKRGFFLESLVYNQDPVLPPSVRQNIEAKVNATQIALQKQAELEQSKADAEKKKVTAQGSADAKVIEATAEAQANEVINKSLTPQLVQYYQIQKWNGQTPQVVGSGSGLILDLKK